MLQEIKLRAESLDLGETIREVCPSCRGGTSREKSFTISKLEDGSVRYNCFRAKCSCSGGFVSNKAQPSKALKDSTLVTAKRKENHEPKITTYQLTVSDLAWIEKHWRIANPSSYFFYRVIDYGGRIAMSIRGPRYQHRGWVLRDITGKAKTKALTYIKPGEVPLSWYKNHGNVGTIIVEDIPSAVRASVYMDAVALLGIGAGDDRAEEIAEYARGPIYIALDQDAIPQAIAMKNQWNLLWDSPTVVPLSKDIKDMTQEGLDDFMSGFKDNNNERTPHSGQRNT